MCEEPRWKRNMKLIFFLSWPLLFASAQNLVLIGGNLRDDNAPIWNKMVELAGGPGVATIGVISASKTLTQEAERVMNNFMSIYGAKNATSILLYGTRADDPAVVAEVSQQTGIFIVEDSGEMNSLSFWELFQAMLTNQTNLYRTPSGVVAYESPSQNRLNLIETLRPGGVDSLVMTAIRDLFNKNGMVAGNSGIMSDAPLILRGDSIGALMMGTSFSYWPKTPPVYSSQGGLGLLKGYVIDSELSERGRELRLIRAVLDQMERPDGVPRGLGIDTNTALVVNTQPLSCSPVGQVITAKGATSGIFYVDLTNWNVTNKSHTADGVYTNIPFSFLTVNDTIDLHTGEATYASWKVAIAGEEWFDNAIPSADILSRSHPSQWRETARRLIDCKEVNVTSYSPHSVIPWLPRIEVFMDRKQAVGYGADLPDGNLTYVPSYRGMLASVKIFGLV